MNIYLFAIYSKLRFVFIDNVTLRKLKVLKRETACNDGLAPDDQQDKMELFF